MRRRTDAGLMAIALATTLVTACHGGGSSSRPEPMSGGVFGDTSALGVRIVAVDSAGDRATYNLAAPAHIVALWVVPGQRLGQIDAPVAADTAATAAGVHELRVSASRAATTIGAARLLDDADYRRCIDENVRTAAQQRVGRDSSGVLLVDDARPDQSQTALEAERRAQRVCARTRNRPAATMPTADRFLVLIASSARLTPQQLRDRVTTMSITATDLPTTMTAVADALYFDHTATWSGYYTRW